MMLTGSTSASWGSFDEPCFGDVEQLYGRRPGIYKVILLEKDRKGPLPIRRLIKDDPSGVVYIGKADSIIQRFVQLRKAVWAAYRFSSEAGHLFIAPGNHVIGIKLSESFRTRFVSNPMIFEIHGFGSEEEVPDGYTARAHETQLIADYIEEFGEPPPFNDQR